MALRRLPVHRGKGRRLDTGEPGGGRDGAGGRLISAGSADWAVDVKIILTRPRARMTEIAESFWSLVKAPWLQCRLRRAALFHEREACLSAA